VHLLLLAVFDLIGGDLDQPESIVLVQEALVSVRAVSSPEGQLVKLIVGARDVVHEVEVLVHCDRRCPPLQLVVAIRNHDGAQQWVLARGLELPDLPNPSKLPSAVSSEQQAVAYLLAHNACPSCSL